MHSIFTNTYFVQAKQAIIMETWDFFIRTVYCWIIVREYLAKNLNLNHASLHDLIDLPQENPLPT